jgi:hypothetical protein
VNLALDIQGRWSTETANYVRLLPRAKIRETPELVCKSCQTTWQSRYSTMLTVAAQRKFAVSLLELPLCNRAVLDGDSCELCDAVIDRCLGGADRSKQTRLKSWLIWERRTFFGGSSLLRLRSQPGLSEDPPRRNRGRHLGRLSGLQPPPVDLPLLSAARTGRTLTLRT